MKRILAVGGGIVVWFWTITGHGADALSAKQQRNVGIQEKVAAASLVPWRDPHPVLPLAGFSLDEQEAQEIMAIYAQASAAYAAVPPGPEQGVGYRPGAAANVLQPGELGGTAHEFGMVRRSRALYCR
jgi:hypothetical protein